MSDTFENYKKWFEIRRAEITDILYNRTAGIVQQGPFKGTRILKKVVWGDGDLSGKLLGLYESELYEYIEEVIQNSPDLVLNVGCAEGFYGIGFGKRTDAQIVLVDIDKRLTDIARENASLNSINKIHFTNDSSIPNFQQYLAKYKNPFILMDCEGSEEKFLNLDLLPELVKSTIIVESHDCVKLGLTDLLISRFKDTHKIKIISQGCKNPYLDIIKDFNDWDKMIICCEFRPSTMYWLYMVPKNEY